MALVNFEVTKGDTFFKSCTFRNKGTNVPVNLTGAVFSGIVVKGVSSVPLTCAVVSASLGQFSFGLSPAQTALLVAGIYQIQVQVMYADTTVKTLITGNLVVQEQLV